MKRDRSVASGSTIEGGGAIVISPSRVRETGSGTHRTSGRHLRLDPRTGRRRTVL